MIDVFKLSDQEKRSFEVWNAAIPENMDNPDGLSKIYVSLASTFAEVSMRYAKSKAIHGAFFDKMRQDKLSVDHINALWEFTKEGEAMQRQKRFIQGAEVLLDAVKSRGYWLNVEAKNLS